MASINDKTAAELTHIQEQEQIIETELPPVNAVPLKEPSFVMVEDDTEKPTPPNISLWKLFTLFLYFGFNAWGGPVAQIALLKDHLVDKEKWISVRRFNRIYAVYQILPGPEAAELCCYFGYIARGRIGSIVGGMGFVLPGFVLMLLLSYVYTLIGLDNVYFVATFKALQPVVAAFVFRAVHKIADHALIDHTTGNYNPFLSTLAILSAFNSALHINFFITLGIFGLVFAVYDRKQKTVAVILLLALYGGYAAYVATKGYPGKTSLGLGIAKTPDPGQLTALGLLGGLLSFGGAYTAIPFVQQEAVVLGKWITQQQFLDGIALGNILPAPLVIFSTFVGFLGGRNSGSVGDGFTGAIVMTIGMFIPCFSFTLLGHRFFERVIAYKPIHAFLDGVTGSVIGLIAITALDLLRASVSTNLLDPRQSSTPSGSLSNVNYNALAAVVFMVTLATLYKFRKRHTAIVVVFAAAIAGQFLFLPAEV